MKQTSVFERVYVVTAVAILSITATIKLYSSLGSARILERTDPILKMPTRELLIGTGFLEMMIVFVLLLGAKPLTKYLSAVWLSANFVLYHFVHWYWKIPTPCACLGHVTDQLGLRPNVVNRALLLVVAYLFLGGLACCFIAWLREQDASHKRNRGFSSGAATHEAAAAHSESPPV